MAALASPRLLGALAVAGLASCTTTPAPVEPTLDVVLDAEPDALTNVVRAEFAFHADAPDAAFTCVLDASSYPCTSTFVVDALADGAHAFEVVASAHGEIGPPTRYAWSVDATAPLTTIFARPAPIATSATAEIGFLADPDAVGYRCAVDGATFAACESPAIVTLGDGDHRFAVFAVDAAGNAGDAAETTWIIDTVFDDTVITTGPADGSTTGRDVTFAYGSADPDARFECAFDGATFLPCPSSTFETLPDGDHQFSVRAIDLHGLVDATPATRAFHVDGVSPSVQFDQRPDDPTQDKNPRFRFSSPDATATFECALDEAMLAACTSPLDFQALDPGEHLLAVIAIDPFGNRSPLLFADWTIR